MRRSTFKAILLAMGLAIAVAEYGTPARDDVGSDAQFFSSLRENVWAWIRTTPPPATETPSSRLLINAVGVNSALAAEGVPEAAAASQSELPSQIIEMRRESLIRRARDSYAGSSVSL
jgi:hypothetical protein